MVAWWSRSTEHW